MQSKIKSKLKELETQHNIKIVLAVESGSRAWGFASPNSDYDIRFIYLHPKEHYLKLEKTDDVITPPIEDELDMAGWDLQKALRLMHSSNPSLMEWLSSPIVYRSSDTAEPLKAAAQRYYQTRSGIWHYLSMASGNYEKFLTEEFVPMKKYLYVFRSVLACRWILEHQSPPPILFDELVQSQLPNYLRPKVETLVELKKHNAELEPIARIAELNDYLYSSMNEIKEAASRLPREPTLGWEDLNNLFLNCLGI